MGAALAPNQPAIGIAVGCKTDLTEIAHVINEKRIDIIVIGVGNQPMITDMLGAIEKSEDTIPVIVVDNTNESMLSSLADMYREELDETMIQLYTIKNYADMCDYCSVFEHESDNVFGMPEITRTMDINCVVEWGIYLSGVPP